jgi:UDP-3-O-[3-hydroxymyristoyl] glucosamine N-acyltransferase
MEFSAQQIADFLNGEIQGDASVKVQSFAKIEEGKPGMLTFLSNPKYVHHIYDTEASIVLVNKDFQPDKPIKATLIRVEDAYQSLAILLSLVENAKPRKTGISPLAHITSSATIGTDVYIAPFVSIGENVTIGNNCMIHSNCCIDDNVHVGSSCQIYGNVTIYNDCVIGNNCILHAGAVIGSDGFGFAPTEDGSYKKIPQMGNVIVEDDVEIGANTTVDRATMGSTILRKGVKLDNLIQIAHNVEVGENTVMAAQSGIAGSAKVGKNCMIGGQVAIVGHISLADGTIIGGQAGVANTIKESGQILQGSPAIPIINFRKSSIAFKGLPELQKTVYALKKQIEELENRI